MARIDQNLSDITDDDMESSGKRPSLPTGNYLFMMMFSDYRANSKNNGYLLEIHWTCVEPDRSNYELREYINLRNPSAEAVKIGRAQLKAIAIAVGHPNPDFVGDSEELHNVPVLLDVRQEEAKSSKDFQDARRLLNRIVGYEPNPRNGGGARANYEDSAPANLNAPPMGDEPPPHSDNDIPF